MAFSLRSVLFASTTLTVLTSCGGQDTADALIGPEGGVVAHDNGITLTVPPGALLAPTRQIIIRPSDEKLSRGNFEQVGAAYLIEPRDLEFRIPAELTFDTSIKEKPTVLLMPGDKRVIAYSADDDKPTAYIGTLGVVAAAKGGEADATIDAPKLARVPGDTDLKTPAIDSAEVKVTPNGVTSLDLGFTAFDISGESKALLNGDGTNYCGFQLGAVLGASKIGGCSLNLASGVLQLSAPQATVQVQPFLIGKLERPVIVEVQVGTGDLVVSAGYFAFNTSGCFLESCAGHGTCVETGGKASCMCNDGYATTDDPLRCDSRASVRRQTMWRRRLRRTVWWLRSGHPYLQPGDAAVRPAAAPGQHGHARHHHHNHRHAWHLVRDDRHLVHLGHQHRHRQLDRHDLSAAISQGTIPVS